MDWRRWASIARLTIQKNELPQWQQKIATQKIMRVTNLRINNI